jgi:hypothetical protein
VGTFFGGILHTLPFLLTDYRAALVAAVREAMRDEGGLDGAAAGRAVAHAIQLILEDAKSTKKEP